jgi:AraC family transcriptional regulator
MASEAPAFYQYIFNSWLPGSGYRLDNRPHFAVMGEKYKNDDPNSEEELCVPVKEK